MNFEVHLAALLSRSEEYSTTKKFKKQTLMKSKLESIEHIKKFSFFLVFPHPLGILNQKNLWPTLIYQFEHLYQWSGTPYSRGYYV